MLYAVACIDEFTYGVSYQNKARYQYIEYMKFFEDRIRRNRVVVSAAGYREFKKLGMLVSEIWIVTDDFYFKPSNKNEKIVSIEDVIRQTNTEDKTYIIGGSMLYHIFIPHIQRMYITEVICDFEKIPVFDAFFPRFKKDRWEWGIIDEYQVEDGNRLLFLRYTLKT